MTIIIDASVLCAFANLRDIHHEKAKSIIFDILDGKYNLGIITEHIFDEVVSVTLRKSGKKSAINIGNYLLNSGFSLARTNRFMAQKAWELFQEDNTFSFTDCTCVAFMKMVGISHIATFDKEFKKQKGITVVGI